MRRLGGQLLAVEEVASGRAGLPAVGSLWRVPAALGDHGQAAGLESPELADHSVTAAELPGPARADSKRVPLDAERAAMLEAFKDGDRRAAVEDVLWAVLNTKEFLYNR